MQKSLEVFLYDWLKNTAESFGFLEENTAAEIEKGVTYDNLSN
jgi:hypothetical protein